MSAQHLVYVENISGVPHNIPICSYEGTNLKELKALFHSKIPTHENVLFEFYTKRFGSSYNSLCPDMLPNGLNMVYVRVRSTVPASCSVCGPKDECV